MDAQSYVGVIIIYYTIIGSFGVKKDRTTTAVLSSKAHISYNLYLWFRVANFMQSFVFCCVLVTYISSWSGSNAASQF